MAASVWLYDTPTVPAGSDAVVIDNVTGAGFITIDNALVAVAARLSVTMIVKLYVAAVVGVPDITPVVVFSVNPAGSAPVLFDHV